MNLRIHTSNGTYDGNIESCDEFKRTLKNANDRNEYMEVKSDNGFSLLVNPKTIVAVEISKYKLP